MSRRLLRSTICLFLFAVSLTAARGQFYAPDTDFHDPVQRHFVVEIARVQAWRANQSGTGPKVAEVTYEVATNEERATVWSLHWLDATGKPLRDIAVTYPGKAVAGGPEWYRDVARQVGLGNAKLAAARPLAASFWDGASSAEPSRADSLVKTFTIPPEKEPARLAGLLAQAALPSVGGRVSLDNLLLARAAAWLCVAETTAPVAGQKTDGLWAVIFFLAGRENIALDLWKATPPADNPTAKWWAFMMGRPNSPAVFAAAADPLYRPWAMPMLAYESLNLMLGQSVPPVVSQLYPDEKALAPWHDYGPFLELNTTVGGGKKLAGAFAPLSRLAAAACLRQLPADPPGFAGYADALKQMGDKLPTAGKDDPELAGWKEAAPLLNLGYHEGRGKLTPVATVSARDLLNFAWEMSGVQMGGHWKFIHYYRIHIPMAERFAKAAISEVEGSEAFFVNYPFQFPRSEDKGSPYTFTTRPHLTDFARLQETGGMHGEWVVPGKVFNPEQPENALLWLRRCWLQPDFILNQCRHLFFNEGRDAIGPALRRLHREGGPRMDDFTLNFFVYGLSPTGLPMCPGSAEARQDLARSETEVSRLGILMLERFEPLGPFESAQRREKLFWQRPGSDLDAEKIFSEYIAARAYEAAKRFYRQALPYLDDPLSYVNDMAPRRFALAMMEGDRDGMSAALGQDETGSTTDYLMRVTFSAFNGDPRGAEYSAKLLAENYWWYEEGAASLKEFLPLLPALKDPASPDHAKALDHFEDVKGWPTFQWVVLNQAKLPPEEAARFLGGKDTDPERLMMAAYVLRDKELFTKTYDAFVKSLGSDNTGTKKWQNMPFVIIHWMRHDLLGTPAPASQPDLKPATVQSLTGVFNARFHARKP